MATNDLLQFATDNTNTLTQAEYLADSQRISGNVPGVARSKLVNKAARQAAFVASMVGAFTSNNSGQDVLDNGDAATFLANFQAALLAYMRANAATETQQGVIRIATTALAQALTNDTDALTPKKLADAFSGARQSKTPNGVQFLPNNLIFQWASGARQTVPQNTSNTNIAISFPIPFPNSALFAVATCRYVSGTHGYTTTVSQSTSGAVVDVSNASTSGGNAVLVPGVLVIGY
ncbi:Uncharacterised protein [Achromobacter xylosoxidans]|uniref:gp53-like domain-containing protein n=1 Tax=Alcaligenes xylosoxydans xylosoxydans TaxID=85698 RepID=UPI0006C51E8D|nr:hypothetical protein [Achromobacter xylosoxidans]CUJ53808.1 Uncharacterised protein [Achromobacter xylosoxidans]